MISGVPGVLPLLEKVFDLPVYMGDLSKARPRRDAAGLLAEARSLIATAGDSEGYRASDHYCLAIISRYTDGDEEAFRLHMRNALAADPDFLEAQLALRDGFVYQGPFCYPTRKDLCDGRASFRPSIVANPEPKNCRVDYIRDGLALVPAVVVKYPRRLFRTALNEDTPADILVEIEAVLPTMQAMMTVIPVVFDDEDDPFWLCSYVNLFPIESDLHGVALHPRSDYRPFEGRDYAQRLCRGPAQMALFIVDTEHQLMFSRLVECPDESRERISELAAVVDVLGDTTVSYDVWKSATDIHDQSFHREITSPSGRVVGFPKSNEKARKRTQGVLVFPVVAVNDRLTAKRGEVPVDAGLRRSGEDVFLIHAHGDQDSADALFAWLREVWPSLKMFKTSPDDQSRFERDPLFFLSKMHRSKCIVFLATKLSVARPWIGAELGGAERIPVITVLAPGTGIADLRQMREGHLFTKIDLRRVADISTGAGWAALAALLGDALDRQVPHPLPEGPVLRPGSAAAASEDEKILLSSFADDLERTLVLGCTEGAQTESQAEDLVNLLEDAVAKLAADAGEIIRWERLPEMPLRGRLACLLMTITDDAPVIQILRALPALVDDELARGVLIMAHGARSQRNTVLHDGAQRLLRLVRAAQRERGRTSP